jgi:hypothetical protein
MVEERDGAIAPAVADGLAGSEDEEVVLDGGEAALTPAGIGEELGEFLFNDPLCLNWPW